jgi:diguanylate cyclase (GGDEF)-like protein
VSDAAPHIDVHTGAWRKDYFENQLAEALSARRRERRPFALLRLDVDDLQEQNDLHGREALDLALSWLVGLLGELLDGRGPIGRLGGDDFAVYLPDLSREQARALANLLVERVPQTEHTSETGPFRLTVSVGVAFARKGEPSGNLLDAAEAACVRAKQSGRNAAVHR